MKGMRKLSITATAMVAAAVMARRLRFIQLVQFIQQFGKHLRHQNQ